MKNKLLAILLTISTLSLCACGTSSTKGAMNSDWDTFNRNNEDCHVSYSVGYDADGRMGTYSDGSVWSDMVINYQWKEYNATLDKIK